MTYKTRQEVLRAAADWMDVCEAAGIEATCKVSHLEFGVIGEFMSSKPEEYEFPLALLEGKEVWVGSELYDQFGDKVTCSAEDVRDWSKCSWNQPKPKTVMVEMLVGDAEAMASMVITSYGALASTITACRKSLDSLK